MLKAATTDILKSLTDEISQWDPGMFPINNKPQCEHEVEIVKVDDEFLQKIYQLHLFYTREANRAGADLSVNHEDPDTQKTFTRASDRAELLRVLFWHLVCEKYEIWDDSGVGLRKGWSVVKVHDHGPGEFVKRLMGGR